MKAIIRTKLTSIKIEQTPITASDVYYNPTQVPKPNLYLPANLKRQPINKNNKSDKSNTIFNMPNVQWLKIH
jgi:hypothetical protein